MAKLTITLNNGVEITQGDSFGPNQKADVFLALANSFEKNGEIKATSKDGSSVNARFSDVKSIKVDFDN